MVRIDQIYTTTNEYSMQRWGGGVLRCAPNQPQMWALEAVEKPGLLTGLRVFDRPLITRLGHAV
jgi:hypothetical protein